MVYFFKEKGKEFVFDTLLWNSVKFDYVLTHLSNISERFNNFEQVLAGKVSKCV